MELKVEYVNINTIKPYKRNAKTHPKEQIEQIKKSIQEFGNCDPIGVWHGEIVEGHGRYLALKELGETTIPIIRLDSLTDEQRRAYGLVHNQLTMNSPWDLPALDLELADLDFDMSDFGFDEPLPPPANMVDVKYNSLAEKYIEPPFSVLDGRKGSWQERKRYWINDVGIKSAETRTALKSGGTISVPGYYDIKNEYEAKHGKISGVEFREKVLPEMLNKNSTVEYNRSGGGIVSIFDPVLAEILYRWFAVPNGSVIDPFAGGCVRGVMASFCGLDYTGVDIRQDQVDANVTAALNLCKEHFPAWACGDSTEIDKIAPGSYDFLFSCPPYADLEKYSDNEKDISNMPYEKFLQAYRGIINKSCAMLKENRFAVFVVGEFRGNNGAYRNFIADTIQAFLDAGLRYYNEIIYITPAGSLPLRVNSMWKTRKVGKTHQNVLVFYKGDMKQIKNIYTDTSALDAIKEEKSLDI